ncbi:carbohydrate ABC transporter permease [Paenibacillus sp. 1P07SE]|uniref:carbohydrate ABC transporter permease n=1 Tax=Paenibacillus sp. 1P07SE TaxID=3132209 RepID=UPI0039A6088F
MRESWGDKTFNIVNYILLTIGGLLCLLPLMHIIAISLSDSFTAMSGVVGIWPQHVSFQAYKLLFTGTNMAGALWNSIIITVVGVTSSMIFTIMAAYPLSRKIFYARRFFTLAIVFTMLFGGGAGGIIPTYLVVKSLGLVNTYGALWLPSLVIVFNLLILRTFFVNISEELVEAAKIDGCSEGGILLRVMLPLSTAVLATLALFYGVHNWNYFLQVLIYINDADKYNLTVLVQNMIQSATMMNELQTLLPEETRNMTPVTIRSAGIVVLLLPMVMVYPFIQRFFVKGVMLGAVKG